MAETLLTVTIAPTNGVALIQVPDGELYSLMRGRGVRVEKAPQMFNLHHDKSRYTVEMEDEHPFDKVRNELETAASRGSLVLMLIETMDTELSDELRQNSARLASKIVADYPETMDFARRIMLTVPLSAEFEIKDGILAKLSQPLQELFGEIVAKWRS